MNTNALKRFATTSRNLLIKGVQSRLRGVGFNKDGSVAEEPTLSGKVSVLYGNIVGGTEFYDRWQELRRQIDRHGVKEVIEQAAYTWFNRFMAIRILDRNNLAPDILQYENPEVHLPKIVTDARAGKTPVLNESQRTALNEVIFDGSKTYEQFSVLIQAYCENNAILRSCFGGITDYTMLVLPPDILGEGNFIDLLNETSSLIDRDDYRKPDLIGWLYQFYIADKKDEVISKKGIYEIDEIPAATQLFTPNWMVKFMVENSLGRIYLDNNPGSHLAENWKYLVNPKEPTCADAVLHYSSLEQLTCADLSCGSGHILNEMFDLLYQLYEEDFYSPREAIETIFRKNMVGIDIDVRAQQLATFALLLKACQRDSAFTSGYCLPRIYSFPDVDRYTWRDTGGHFNTAYKIHVPNAKVGEEIDNAFDLMKDADVLGSIMKFEICEESRQYLKQAIEMFDNDPKFANDFSSLVNGFRIIIALTEDYAVIGMNPPFLGRSKMSNILKEYIELNYKFCKADLFGVFLCRCLELLQNKGNIGFLTPSVWLYINSFEDLRDFILDNSNLLNLIQLEYNAFEPACVPVITFCLKKGFYNLDADFIRLVEFKGHQNQSPRTLEAIQNKNCGWYFKSNPNIFNCIPGKRISGYWVDKRLINSFSKTQNLGDVGVTRKGMYTGLNERYVRNWFEVCKHELAIGFTKEKAIESDKKWYPYANGGYFRKWFGNYWDVVFWQHNGKHLRSEKDENGKLRAGAFNLDYIYRRGVVWNAIGSSQNSMRIMYDGSLFSSASNGWFGDNPVYILGLLNSKVSRIILDIINPTLNANAGDLALVPVILSDNNIESIINECISISKNDWDAHETSWDFLENPLVGTYKDNGWGTLKMVCEEYEAHWTLQFARLHKNEEEINRRFIEIYGLQDEIWPEVTLKEVTILQQGEISLTEPDEITREKITAVYAEDFYGRDKLTEPFNTLIHWNRDVTIKQLISYAVGCMMGRYRLDRPGLAIAHPNPSAEEIAEYVVPQTGKSWWIDDDGIVPMMDDDCGFHDNASNRFSEFIEAVFGTDSKTENLNFVREALGKDIVDYFRTDFYADHKKMYQNRPIYWMFSSNQKGKRAAFQCLVYMHRMNRFTPEHIRTNYLLPYIETLAAREADLSSRTSLTARENKQLKQIKADLEECREYQLRLHDFADQQIEIDLDDGVVKNYATFAPVLAKLK